MTRNSNKEKKSAQPTKQHTEHTHRDQVANRGNLPTPTRPENSLEIRTKHNTKQVYKRTIM